MEKSIKGGYILISLGLSELSTFDDNLPYDRIIATKKHVVLTGIMLDGEKMPDVCVSPKFEDNAIILSDVYGYDIQIENDNTVSVSEYQKSSPLYKHRLDFSTDDQVVIISNSSTPLTKDTTKLTEAFETMYLGHVISDLNDTGSLVSISSIEIAYFDTVAKEIISIDISEATMTDTVTKL